MQHKPARLVGGTDQTFITLNDGALEADDFELYPIILALADGKLPESEFAASLRRHVGVNPGNQQIQEPRAKPYRARRGRAGTRKPKP